MKRNYKDPHYKKFRQEVLKRDGRKCKMCDSRKKLQVHHIRRWANAALMRYDPSNGITLCKMCHQKVTGHEKIYESYFLRLLHPNQ